MESLRDTRQKEFSNAYVRSEKFSILHIAPRVGKCYVGINILEMLSPSSVLIAYPDHKIRSSWESDFKKRHYDSSNVTFTTHLSLHKHEDQKYGLIIIDEIHLLSPEQIGVCRKLFKLNKYVLGLSGTLSKATQKVLLRSLKLPVLINYPIKRAIEEGIIADYEITVVRVALDNTVRMYKGKTEKRKFDNISWVIDRHEEDKKDTFFLRLQRTRIIQNSVAKTRKTISLLQEYKNERVLVFCGLTKIADSLGVPSHHSKSKDKEIFNKFLAGETNHLAVVKIGNTGVTYKPLSRIIINYFDSNSENLAQKLNRAMNFEYDNPDKVAKITIICSNEDVELRWLKRALEFFDKDKITYL